MSSTKKSLKIALLGDGSTGKTTYFNKIKEYNNPDYKFPKKYNATSNFNLQILPLNTNFGNVLVDIWDTAGQEKFGGDLRNAYIYGADGIIILYDIGNRKTIENVPKWLSDTYSTCGDIPVVVVGNKIDKKRSLTALEEVKFRDVRLKKLYGGKSITNVLFSIKENKSVEIGKYWQSDEIVKGGLFKPFEYILSTYFKRNITVTPPKMKVCNNDFGPDDF